MNQKKQTRDEFINRCMTARFHLYKILEAYEDLEHEDNDQTSIDYPFGSSYDEWLYEYDCWLDKLVHSWTRKVLDYQPTVTVGELKNVLSAYNDGVQIVIGTDNWYKNIESVQLPNNDDTFTIILYPGKDFDTRQI